MENHMMAIGMSIGRAIAGGLLGAALMLIPGGAGAFDDANYPDLKPSGSPGHRPVI
jgi:hypothetical protein